MIASHRPHPTEEQRDLFNLDPSPDEITAATASIRAGLSERALAARRGGPSAVSWSVPFVDSREIGLEEDR
jgi:hypothetical protein